MERGIYYSAGLHLAMLFLAWFGLPHLFDRDLEPEPVVITLEQLPIKDITNVKPSEKKPAVDKQKKPSKTTKPAPPVKKKVEKPEPKKEAVKIPDKEKPKPKEKEKEPDKKKPKEKEDLDAILKSVREAAQSEDKDKKKEKDSAPEKASTSEKYDPTIPLSITEKDAIISQFRRCWRMPAGARGDYDLRVIVHVKLNPDGSVLSSKLDNSHRSRYGNDTFFRAAADSARRAVQMCSPIQGLSPDKYNAWKDMELTFDPKDLLY